MNWQQAVGLLQNVVHAPDHKRSYAEGLAEDMALDILTQIAQEWEGLKRAQQAEKPVKPTTP